MLLFFFFILFIFLCFTFFSLLDFSLWFLVLQSFLTVLMVFVLIFYFSGLSSSYHKVSSFLFLFLLLEVLFEVVFFLNYVFSMEVLFLLLLVFKSSCFPFIFYQEFFKCFSLSSVFFSILVLFYLFSSKVLLSSFIFVIPLEFSSVLVYLTLSSLFLIFSFSFYSFSSFVVNSFIFSNLTLILVGLFFSAPFLLFYLLITSFFQYKVLIIFSSSKFNVSISSSYFYLMLVNGSPLFVFNWFKFVLQSFLLDVSVIVSFLYVVLSSLFLVKSVHMFLQKGFKMFFFSIMSFSILVLLFVSFLFELWFLFLSSSDVFSSFSFLVFISFNSYQFSNLLPNVFSFNFFLMFGENISVGVFLIFFLFFIFFSGFNFSSFLSFSGVDFSSSVLSSSHIVSFLGLSLSVSYFDNLVFLFPYLLIIVSTSNFMFLSNSVSFLNVSDFSVLVSLVSFQWGWDFSLSSSSNSVSYLSLFYNSSFNSFNYFNSGVKTFSFLFLGLMFSDCVLSSFISLFLVSNPFVTSFLPCCVSVLFQCVSLDVIHSVFIPALSLKEDLFVGKVCSFFFYVPSCLCSLEVVCFEFCGDFHHSMLSVFSILPSKTFSVLYDN